MNMGAVSLVSFSITMSGLYWVISQSRYCCFLGALMPLTFHISNVSGTLWVLKLPLAGCWCHWSAPWACSVWGVFHYPSWPWRPLAPSYWLGFP